MRTTIRLRDDLLKRAKKRAAEEHRALTSVVEEGVVLVLARPATKRRGRIKLRVPWASGGVVPGVDRSRSTEIEALMEDS